jgi:hypothetical protein
MAHCQMACVCAAKLRIPCLRAKQSCETGDPSGVSVCSVSSATFRRPPTSADRRDGARPRTCWQSISWCLTASCWFRRKS